MLLMEFVDVTVASRSLHVLCFTVSLLSVVFPVSSRCLSGRIYIGTIGSSFPAAVRFNGIYVADDRPETDATRSEELRSVYRHELRPDQILYHVNTGKYGGHWVVGTNNSDGTRTELVRSSAALEINADYVTSSSVLWMIRNHLDATWTLAGRLVKATCVGERFVTCTSGQLVISGLTERHVASQGHRTGRYEITSRTSQLRPVYKHVARNEYLFFVDGMWMIGPEPGRRAGGLFVQDEAWRPEYILSQWYVAMTTTGRVETDSRLTVVCYTDRVDGVTSGQAATAAPTDLMVDSSDSADSDEVNNNGPRRHLINRTRRINPCNPAENERICYDGRGKCTLALGGDYCQCNDGYFGSNCSASKCSEPQPLAAASNSYVSTDAEVPSAPPGGRSFLDVVFYRCSLTAGDATVYTGRVCQLDGTWSAESYPDCPRHALITPEHPELQPRVRYRQQMNRRRPLTLTRHQ